MTVFEKSFVIHVPQKRVWDFHSDPVTLTQITPKPIQVRIHSCDYPVRDGSKVLMTLSIGPFAVRWNSVIVNHAELDQFTDQQIQGQGPFKSWRHTHRFQPSKDGTLVTDHVEYALPFGLLGKLADAIAGRWIIHAMFNARARATRAHLERSIHTPTLTGANTHASA
jgi:ligand-binding SRPBCC domain-containing protein